MDISTKSFWSSVFLRERDAECRPIGRIDRRPVEEMISEGDRKKFARLIITFTICFKTDICKVTCCRYEVYFGISGRDNIHFFRMEIGIPWNNRKHGIGVRPRHLIPTVHDIPAGYMTIRNGFGPNLFDDKRFSGIYLRQLFRMACTANRFYFVKIELAPVISRVVVTWRGVGGDE